MHLQTDRLLLRAWREEDHAPFAALNADPDVARHLAGPMTRVESDALAERIAAHWARWGFGLFAVEERASGAFVGFTGLSHHRALPDEVEIGWRLARPLWGRGLATEAATAVRDWAFGPLGLDCLVSLTTAANVASRRIMEKIGMTCREELSFEQWTLLVYTVVAVTPK